MTSFTDAGQGVRLAQEAVAAASLDDDRQALELINAANEGEVKWAAAYLVDCLIQAADQLPGMTKAQARHALRKAIANDEDIIATQAAVYLQEEADHG